MRLLPGKPKQKGGAHGSAVPLPFPTGCRDIGSGRGFGPRPLPFPMFPFCHGDMMRSPPPKHARPMAQDAAVRDEAVSGLVGIGAEGVEQAKKHLENPAP